MGVFGSIGKALGGVGKALTPGLGGGFNPVKNVKNAGKALGGAPGMGAVGGAVGATPGLGKVAQSIGINAGGPRPGGLVNKLIAAKGLGAPAAGTLATKPIAADEGASLGGGAGQASVFAKPDVLKKSFVGAGRAMRGGRR